MMTSNQWTNAHPRFRVIGMMSGTSLDAVDLAMIETDGYDYVRPMGFMSQALDPGFRDRLRRCMGNPDSTDDFEVALAERELTEVHAALVKRFLAQQLFRPESIDFIGFHGQTLWHNPARRETIQIGDGSLLADRTGIDVVNDFRTADVRAGGQGAPLVPLYHRALLADAEWPVAVLNIGGVANITWIGGMHDDEILAFDTGPGNAMIDDWMLRHLGLAFDRDGDTAAQGRVDDTLIEYFLRHPYFSQKAPKSLDRDMFKDYAPKGLDIADGAATLTMMTVKAIARGIEALPQKPRALYLTGGGRHNATMRQWLADQTGLDVALVDVLGWNGDALEAEAFAYLAVRTRLGLPLSLQGTTGVPFPTTGGTIFKAPKPAKETRSA